jgi:hypothetical protein
MGAKKEDETVKEFIHFMERTISDDYTAETKFLGEFDKWTNQKITKGKMRLIPGTDIGTRTIDDESVTVETLLGDDYIHFYGKMYGIWIPDKMILKRRHYEWFARLSPEQIFEIESKDTYIKFYLVANDLTGKRARIYGINAKTGTFENGIAFYWNGNVVREPVITLSEWGTLGVSFPKVLDFDSYVGGIRFTGSALVNNISQYKATGLQEIQRNTLRSWFLASIDNLVWNYWGQSFSWNGVLILSQSNILGVNPSDIYKTYTGTNKIIIDDNVPLKVINYEYNLYQGVTWQSKILPAV